MPVADQLEQLAANTQANMILFHWGEQAHNREWIQAFQTQPQLQTHIKKVNGIVGQQIQGMGFYGTTRPDAYTVKQKESDELLVVNVNGVDSIDAARDPVNPSPLYNIATTKTAIMSAVHPPNYPAAPGFPPRILLKYGDKYYRLTTVTNVAITDDLTTVPIATVRNWKTMLLQYSDRTSFRALKAQATRCNIAEAANW